MTSFPAVSFNLHIVTERNLFLYLVELIQHYGGSKIDLLVNAIDQFSNQCKKERLICLIIVMRIESLGIKKCPPCNKNLVQAHYAAKPLIVPVSSHKMLRYALLRQTGIWFKKGEEIIVEAYNRGEPLTIPEVTQKIAAFRGEEVDQKYKKGIRDLINRREHLRSKVKTRKYSHL